MCGHAHTSRTTAQQLGLPGVPTCTCKAGSGGATEGAKLAKTSSHHDDLSFFLAEPKHQQVQVNCVRDCHCLQTRRFADGRIASDVRRTFGTFAASLDPSDPQ